MSSKAWSTSDTSSCSSNTSRVSPTKRLAKLEIATENSVLIQQINKKDPRIPKELKPILRDLDSFQSRIGIVPVYLEAEIQTRARDDDNFDNFIPSTFGKAYNNTCPTLLLSRILHVFELAKECFNEDHVEATWNALVHWPVFDLALGSMADVSETGQSASATGKGPGRDDQVCVRGMPCTAARLAGCPPGSKMVDYCIFVEPQAHEAAIIDKLQQTAPYINHTDYNALRRRPIVLSAVSKKPGEGFRAVQLQLGVWQAAQWTFLLGQLTADDDGKTKQTEVIPFLPALIIQGHDWHFTATTRFHDTTVCILQHSNPPLLMLVTESYISCRFLADYGHSS